MIFINPLIVNKNNSCSKKLFGIFFSFSFLKIKIQLKY